MKRTTPRPVIIFRGFAGLALLGLVGHLWMDATVTILPYRVVAWTIVGVLVLMLFLSWIKKPLSAYAIACFIPLLPAAFLVNLWLIVLKTAPTWEFILVGGSFMLLPTTLSIQIIRDNATRNYFNFSPGNMRILRCQSDKRRVGSGPDTGH